MSDIKLIKGWDDLRSISQESETHYLKIDEHSGHIYSKTPVDDITDRLHCSYGHYLSTHTFYGAPCNRYQDNTKLLREAGFNVQLKNWDGETISYETQHKLYEITDAVAKEKKRLKKKRQRIKKKYRQKKSQ